MNHHNNNHNWILPLGVLVYATQWYLSEMAKQPKLDGWLDFGLRVVSELISS
jgi:hypothetical protein